MLRDISNLRKSYSKNSLIEKDMPKDPFLLFDNWFKEVSSTNKESEIPCPDFVLPDPGFDGSLVEFS